MPEGTSPVFNALGKNKSQEKYIEKISCMIDTGAAISVVHDKWLENVKHEVVAGPNSKVFVNASGKKMGNGKFANFKLKIPGARKKLFIKKALVIDDNTVPFGQILLGMPEILKYEIDLSFSKMKIVAKSLGFEKDLLSEKSVFAVNQMVPTSVKGFLKNSQKAEQESKTFCEFSKNSNDNNLRHPRDYEKEIDGKKAYKKEMKKLHDIRAKQDTSEDVEFDEDFCAKHPGLKDRIKKVLKEYPEVFRNTVGCVPKEYTIKPTFTADFQPARMKQRDRSESEKRAIIKKLDLEFQDGILVFPEDHNVTVTNQIPLIPVSKKDDDGNIIPGIKRVVTNCKIKTNRYTNFASLEVDNLGMVLRQAARASKHKYKLKFEYKVFLEASSCRESCART